MVGEIERDREARRSGRADYRASVTVHVPGVQLIVTEVAVASPVQLCGPLKVTFPSALRLPVKPSNGAAKASAQAVWVMTTLLPTSEASQWAVTFQLPLTSGQLPPPVLAVLPLLLPVLPVPPVPLGESEPHAASSRNAASKDRFIPRRYRPARSSALEISLHVERSSPAYPS